MNFSTHCLFRRTLTSSAFSASTCARHSSVRGARGGGTEEPDPAAGALPVNEQVFTIAGMEEEIRRGGRIARVPLEACAGHIAVSYVYLYPPGIPLAAPGERISRETVRHLLDSRRQGFSLEGLEEEGNMKVWIHG